MLSPMKHVFCEYCPLLMKMALDSPTIALAASNVKLFCDVEIVNILVKFTQLRDIFVCDLWWWW